MTSTSPRRSSSGGKPLKTKAYSISSSSTTSLVIETPSDTSAPPSPGVDMPPRTNAADGISEGLEQTRLNGTREGRRGTPMGRKQSTPMMPAFMVSAPGKVIAFGEHAVVHGKVRQLSHSPSGQV